MFLETIIIRKKNQSLFIFVVYVAPLKINKISIENTKKVTRQSGHEFKIISRNCKVFFFKTPPGWFQIVTDSKTPQSVIEGSYPNHQK